MTVLLVGCSLNPPEDSPRVAYREAESTQALVVPPDLTRQSTSSSALEVAQLGTEDGSEVLPEFEDIRMVRAGPIQWLEVLDAAPEELWPRMAGFLRNEGLAVGNEQPAQGIVESVWAKRFDAVSRGGLAGAFSSLFGGVASDLIKDKYQIRLERMDNGEGTRVFLTHWAAQEINTNPNTQDSPLLAMARVQGDPAIAAEMRRRLLIYLGVSRERATTVASARDGVLVYTAPVRLVENTSGEALAVIAEPDYRRAFGLVGEALRLAGADVIESNSVKGKIWVNWLPPKEIRGSGFFSSDRPEKLLIQLEREDKRVFMYAGDSNGLIRSGDVQIALLESVVNAMGGDISSYRNVEDLDDVGTGKADDPEYR